MERQRPRASVAQAESETEEQAPDGEEKRRRKGQKEPRPPRQSLCACSGCQLRGLPAVLSSLLGFGSSRSRTPLKDVCEKSLVLNFRKEGVCWAFISVLSEVVNFLVLGSVSQVSQVWVTGKVPGSTWCKRWVQVGGSAELIMAFKSCLFSQSLASPLQ